MKKVAASGRITRVHVVDSHTAGEPTRVVLAGGPDVGGGPLADQRQTFATEFDQFRSAVINEPRGSDVWVGALLCDNFDPSCMAGVIFFNNVGVLNMCGHGTIGLAVTLAYLGRIKPGEHRIDTPVGQVAIQLHEDLHHVTLENVPSYRHAQGVAIDVPSYGRVSGDVAWGGNWFFLVNEHKQPILPSQIAQLTHFSVAVRAELARQGITGAGARLSITSNSWHRAIRPTGATLSSVPEEPGTVRPVGRERVPRWLALQPRAA